MPHKCAKCESVFKDGAAIILNGCPKCGWNKFLYVRTEGAEPPKEKTETTPETLPQAASKFIKEVDELLGKDAAKTPESKKEDEPQKSQEIGQRVESVRILTQGSYELNLESLLERDEIVMALKEDGTYVLHLPSVFQKKKH